MIKCMQDRLSGDFMEHHTLYGNLWLEYLKQMPRDALTFTVFICCKQQLGTRSEFALDLLDDSILSLRYDILWRVVVLDIDGEILRRKISYMPIARNDGTVLR